MRTLLDTCVLSELLRPQGAAQVKNRVDAIRDEDLYISAVTLGEVAKGVAMAAPGRKRDSFERFLHSLEQDFENRILALDGEAAIIWGGLAATHRAMGKALSVPDGMIAATALRHGLHLMTRNVKDFTDTGALLLNPWQGA